jgi:hypothetical protein
MSSGGNSTLAIDYREKKEAARLEHNRAAHNYYQTFYKSPHDTDDTSSGGT